MIKVACHQPNFCPWLPYFYKMAMVDVFIILLNVQFEKNGFQNRYKTCNDKWVTNPVLSGTDKIINKEYTNGYSVATLNTRWIRLMRDTLDIKTEIVSDLDYGLKKTENLIANINANNGNIYVTNPDAKIKYLDEDLMIRSGIDIEYCKVPKHLNIHTFDAFEKFGIEGTRNILKTAKSVKRVEDEVLVATV
jgi:hypothetical protein